MSEYKKILLTGATGFIGRHIVEELQKHAVRPDTLSRREGAQVVCDLEKDVPHFSDCYDAVIHVAGTDEESRAEALNHQGTLRLLEGLEQSLPRHFIYMSSVHVYGVKPGADVREDCFLRPDTSYARSKIRAEKAVEKWCALHGVGCTILRPALTVGDGMHGRLATMAAAIDRGRYMHLSGNRGRRSLVMACDVAKAVWLTLGVPGVYNVTDGYDHTVRDIAEAIAKNLGTNKRILTLPRFFLKWPLRLLPAESKARKAYETLTATATFSVKALKQVVDFTPYDAVEVMARREPDYPYKES